MSSQLPVHLTRFIGRQREVSHVTRLLAETRLLTLTGPGGSGKTRLALEVAAGGQHADAGSIIWVDLASIADDSLVVQAVAKALGVAEQPGRSVWEALAHFLRNRDLLLILDNCEHLVTACAQLVDGLLSACQALRILTTSREPLALAGEKVYPVPALTLPPVSLLARTGSFEPMPTAVLEELQRSESIALFLDRAAAVVPDFTLTTENARAIESICRRLDGMPLAIELAAARVTVLTADQIVGRLDDQLALLVSSKRGGIAQRHLTLRAAMDWSYALLRPAEQVLLRRLSVFAGGCWLAAAEAVCTDDGIAPSQLLPLLASLVDKSLVTAETLRSGDARYRLLETIRQYAAEQLAVSGETTALRDRHLRSFLQLIEKTEAKLKGEDQQRWLDWLEVAYDNVRAALSWSLESDQIEAGLRMAVALYQFWIIRDYREEGLNWFERLLAQATEAITPVVHVNALTYASLMASFAAQTETQVRYAEAALRLGETAGEESRPALATALGAQAYAARKVGDLHTAFALGLREIELQRELGNRYNLGRSLSYYSFLAMSLGQYDKAHAMLDEGLALLRQAGDPYRLAMALNYRGDLARCEQNYAEAVATYQESITLLRAIDAERDLASALQNQGHAYLHLGDVERARSLFRESMAIHQEQQNTLGMAECLLGFAALALAGSATAAGARLLATAEAVGGAHVTTEWAATRLEYESLYARAHEGLAESVFLKEWAVGQKSPLEQAVVYALKIADRDAAMQAARDKLDALTLREREVVTLIAQAKSNEEIAQQMVVSKRTVETHVSHILAKLGVTSRPHIVRWAIDAGLIQSTE